VDKSMKNKSKCYIVITVLTFTSNIATNIATV